MEMKKISKSIIAIILSVSIVALLPGCHLAKYCSTAEDAAELYLNNEELFIDCQKSLIENGQITHVSYDESQNTVFCNQLYFKTKQPVKSEELITPATAINRLNASVPLINIYVLKDLSRITFLINSMNILNSAVIVYSADGIFPDKYIADLTQINENWAAYITNG